MATATTQVVQGKARAAARRAADAARPAALITPSWNFKVLKRPPAGACRGARMMAGGEAVRGCPAGDVCWWGYRGASAERLTKGGSSGGGRKISIAKCLPFMLRYN